MTKADIAEKVAEKLGCCKRDALEHVETVLKLIKATLESGEKVKITGFGNFTVKQKKPRLGRNPQTGEAITLDARSILTFKPSQLLRQSINSSK